MTLGRQQGGFSFAKRPLCWACKGYFDKVIVVEEPVQLGQVRGEGAVQRCGLSELFLFYRVASDTVLSAHSDGSFLCCHAFSIRRYVSHFPEGTG